MNQQQSPVLEVCFQFDMSHGLELVCPRPHPKQRGGAGLLRVHGTWVSTINLMVSTFYNAESGGESHDKLHSPSLAAQVLSCSQSQLTVLAAILVATFLSKGEG